MAQKTGKAYVITIQIQRVLFLCLTIAGIAGCKGAETSSLVGGGSSTSVLAVQAWQKSLASKGVTLTYNSNLGEKQFFEGSNDFLLKTAGSIDNINKVATGQKQKDYAIIPVLVADIAIVHTLQGCKLSLSKDRVKAVFTGQISSFRQLDCEDFPTTVLTREEDSGNRNILYEYLEIDASAWQKNSSKPRIQPIIAENLENIINAVPGAIGYIPGPLISFDNISTAAIIDRSGRHHQPRISPDAKKRKGYSPDNIENDMLEGSKDYPIKIITFLYLKKQGNGNKLKAVLELAQFAISKKAQQYAEALGYIPLSQEQIKQAASAIQDIKN
jgi:phosphate transport system substrate-binding protein